MSKSNTVLCAGCQKDISTSYQMCDMTDGEWCFVCFMELDCGKGMHGEGCPTNVFSDGLSNYEEPLR